MEHENPILRPVFAGRALTLPSTCSEPPAQPKRMPIPPIIGEIIAKLGLRYRPSGTADLEAHAEALVLLGEDCADIPPPLLDRAAKEWAREQRFMPRASELRALCRKYRQETAVTTDLGLRRLEEHCSDLNQREAKMGGTRKWVIVGHPGERKITVAA